MMHGHKYSQNFPLYIKWIELEFRVNKISCRFRETETGNNKGENSFTQLTKSQKKKKKWKETAHYGLN